MQEYFDEKEADTAVNFIESYCTHVAGSWSGDSLILTQWQRELVRTVFGAKLSNGLRKYRFIWLEAPRKSGKTTFAAAISLYMLLVDKEKSAECYIAASSRSHARECLNIAKRMINNNNEMREVCRSRADAVSYKDNRLSMLCDSKHSTVGRDISFAVLDDMQVGFSRDLYHRVIAGSASRREPLFLCLIAAGEDHKSIGWDLHRYAKSVSEGRVLDPIWYVKIFGASERDDWSNPDVWRTAHPGLNISVSQQFLREQCLLALQNPTYVPAFKREYLNIWGCDGFSWINMEMWDKCERSHCFEQLAGRTCKIGLDLSSTRDLTAVVAVFPEVDGGYTLLPFAFCPIQSVRDRNMNSNDKYKEWISSGYLLGTNGNVVDYTAVRDKILEMCEEYDVDEIAYDRWGATMLINELVDEGLLCTPVNQDSVTLSACIAEFERVISNGTLRHDGNPVLRWCASNVVLQRAGRKNLPRPSKRRSRERIDLVVASLLGVSRFLNPCSIKLAGARF